MNTELHSWKAQEQAKLTAAKRDNAPICFDRRTCLFQVAGHPVGYPAHLRTDAEAQAYASLHGFTILGFLS